MFVDPKTGKQITQPETDSLLRYLDKDGSKTISLKEILTKLKGIRSVGNSFSPKNL